MCVRDHSAIGCLNIEDCAGLSYATKRHGSLRLCGGKTSEEGCTLDIFVVSICFVKLLEMDSHGGLEVTIRQTESKKKLPTNFVKQTPECS